jgi:poly(A) polymerase
MDALILPAADWRLSEGLDALCAALGEARFVGGVVRDTLAGLAPKDIDLATPLSPETVIARLKPLGIKVVPTGIAHGTVTAVLPFGPVEITTLRRDVSTDGRRATIAYTDDWREDAARRDFTINALYADPATGEIFDYFGGLDDLKAGLVRFIGEPLQRIAEDHLRILRYFRFHARFGKGAPHSESLAACAARANDLMALSRERIAQELLALLGLADPVAIIGLMLDHAILKPVLPEVVGIAPLADLITHEGGRFAPDPVRRLAALLPCDPALAEAIANRLKLSNAQRKRLGLLAGRTPMDAENPKALAYKIGVEAARDRLLLVGLDPAPIATWHPPRFPMTGGAIIARGVQAGPEVARLLQQVEREWVEAGFPDKAGLSVIVDRVLN